MSDKKYTPSEQKVIRAVDVLKNALADSIRRDLMDTDPYYLMLAAVQVGLNFVMSTAELGYAKPAEIIKLHDVITAVFEDLLASIGSPVRVGTFKPDTEPVLN